MINKRGGGLTVNLNLSNTPLSLIKRNGLFQIFHGRKVEKKFLEKNAVKSSLLKSFFGRSQLFSAGISRVKNLLTQGWPMPSCRHRSYSAGVRTVSRYLNLLSLVASL